MLVRAASLCMACAFVISKVHNFRVYWHQHSTQWYSADALLKSSVCKNAALRMSIGQFDNCANAESVVTISPLYRAVYSVAEEMHICGNSRCAVFYMDITERLTYICALVILLVFMLLVKFLRDYKAHSVRNECQLFELPQSVHLNRRQKTE